MAPQVQTGELTEYQRGLNRVAEMGSHRYLYCFRHWYMDLFDPPKGARLLDLGGYIGATAHHYARLGHDVTAVEGAAELCRRFAENTPQAMRDRCRVVHSLIEEFSEPASYDACCCTEILNLVTDPAEVLKVAYESLRDGGLLFVTVPATPQPSDARRYTPEGLAADVAIAGFGDVSVLEWADRKHTPQTIVRGVK